MLELWTVKDIRVGEEVFNDCAVDFGSRAWYDERIWSIQVASEIVFQPLHPATGVSVHSERVIAVREELTLHLEYQRDVVDGMRSLQNVLVDAVSKSCSTGHDVEHVTAILKYPYRHEVNRRNVRDKLRVETGVQTIVAKDTSSMEKLAGRLKSGRLMSSMTAWFPTPRRAPNAICGGRIRPW